MGCARVTTVSEVAADPGGYRNKEVTVTGVVVSSASVVGRGLYRIEEGGARLWVATTSGVPSKGSRVVVTGRVYDAFDMSGLPVSLPEAVGSGSVILESARKRPD
jgi:hypothetical protein